MAIEASTHEALQRAAKDHLWLHFSTTASYEGRDVPVIVRGRGLPPLRHAGPPLPRHARRALHGADRLLARRRARRGRGRADAAPAVLHELDVRASPRDRARREARRDHAGEHQPLLLRLGRQRGGRGRLEARAPVPRAPRTADAPQGDRAEARLPRHHDGRALDHRHHRDPHTVRAAHPRRPARREHEPLPLQVLRRQARLHARLRRRDRRGDRVRGARDRRDGDHRARAELGRHLHPPPPLPPARARDLRHATACCRCPTR